ncbi:flavin reductase [Acetobacter pasteurianus]|uniref:FMN reductase (NADH) RutF n=1 Tax=Acetobacter pasteurianus TaxID=438 RepID=A0A1A0DJA0_ACEPA|nr:flavin reductase [Acetobacter pasteurianus]OAZ74732.1 FMN reductase (NADH) RutF [Acetobacter pasteurianus]RCL05214.1 flavin reductase [Acetobacter pasteurianus]GAB31674.1 flavin mononucleotide reductase [Acetobacter pasteurianus subsp. pasteurianus LMG 1262 = NBRC 106471]GCD50887.1 flavin mononucleotide (FMN) reductase [Acetobacter pasteurianus subsp. pasteurianus LMG 1262 = NBRC 106471]
MSHTTLLPTVDSQTFRNGMSLVPGAICIIATDGKNGCYGFTATAVCSVSDTPPTLLVCVNKSTTAHDHILAHQCLSVNVLAPSQEALCAGFSNRALTQAERFALAKWNKRNSGAPLLIGATVSFDCTIAQTIEAQTHTIIIASVVDIVYEHKPQNGLVWYCKKIAYTV